ncbi:MAG: c-type cytochrome domain-containing protein, partial [Planctomycetaceae bacterium]
MSVSLLTPLQADEGIDFFEKRIRPVLADHCYRCHAAEFNDAKGGLTLDTREGIRRGGESGAAIIPGKPEESLLLEAVRYESFQMPPKERLSPQQIADLEKWISMGAPDPRDTPAKTVRQRAAADIDWKEAKQFWAFQSPVSKHPNLSGREVIDQQVSMILQQHELQPNPLADARILLRRLSFTLTGLPPSPQQTQHFLETASNDRAAAIATLTDSLLS